jgi:hypothetical protein
MARLFRVDTLSPRSRTLVIAEQRS